MFQFFSLGIVSILFVCCPPARAQQQTLLFPMTHDASSLETTGKTLSEIHRLDIAAVTPAKSGATMFGAVPTSAISAMIGDPDRDGVIAEFRSDNSVGRWGHAGCLLRNRDKKRANPRMLFWTVQDSGSAQNPKWQVFTAAGTKTRTVRPGDFVRIGENGTAEYFITQELIMKAAGKQPGAAARGASDVCQAKSGDLYYSPPLRGHYVSNGKKQVLAKEGALIWIPASAIRYDGSGNVMDIRAGSARLVAEMGSNVPSSNLTIISMLTNSRAHDRDGVRIVTTGNNWITNLTGLAIDPNGGTFVSNLTGTTKHPNLIFAFANTFYRGTIFSTAVSSGQLGSIAKINGVQMGTQTGKADGRWLGAKGQASSPTLLGLEIAAWGLAPTHPWGLPLLDTNHRGAFDVTKDTSFSLDLQSMAARQPVLLMLGFGPSLGKPTAAVALPGLFAGFDAAYTLFGGPLVGSQGLTDRRGRKFLTVPIPKGGALKGTALIWQALFLSRGKHGLSNPIVTDFR